MRFFRSLFGGATTGGDPELSISRDEICYDFIVAPPTTQVQPLRDSLAGLEWHYIIEPTADGRFRVYQLAHLIEILKKEFGPSPNYDELEVATLGELEPLDRYVTEQVELIGEVDTIDGRRIALDRPLQVVVVLDNGEILGLLGPWTEARDTGDVPLDRDYLPPSDEEAVEPETYPVEPDDELPGTLTPEPAIYEPDLEDRIINVELRDELINPIDARTQALEAGREYRLDFFVDNKESFNTMVVGETIGSEFFEDEVDGIDLTIQLESDDFEIEEPQRIWFVPPTGRSKKVKFNIIPKQDGPATISAIVLKGDRFVQAITLKFFVGELFKIERTGHSLAAPLLPTTRDLNITILDQGNGYQVIMSGAVGAVAKLPITRQYLHNMVMKLRDNLQKDVIYFKNPLTNKYIFQRQLDIPPAIAERANRILANAGWDLFDKLFYGPGHDLQANNMGDRLKEMAKRNQLNIQIFAQNFPLPWGFLYLGDDPDNPERDQFLGLKHIIEVIPLQPRMSVTDNVIDTSEGINIGLNVNRDIDREMRSPIIENQINFWTELSTQNDKIRPDVRDTMMDVMSGLREGEAEDQILYFYCHAISYHLDDEEKGGPDRTRMIFTGNKEFTLRQARRDKSQLGGNPLVFINACESAKLSPEFYDGFVPYFMQKGARGVIGTECEVPALFAEAYAKTFFEEFLKGQKTLGQIFLEMRQSFFDEKNNILGLMYALYVDGDTYIDTPLL